ncbi:hypothetical protein GCM10023144_45370 [Pigmentiphaga soli]|uniref:Uncharacterized protein n=1 Tax=Pigmentiphaga soli TaxID=1007095 RepID=A0ABP8HQV8_9BURK
MSKAAIRHSFWFVWRMPIALAVLTAFGLLAALLGTGIWHGTAWVALFIPIAVACWHALRPR